MQIDGELQLLGHVVGIEALRPRHCTQGSIVVAELGEGKAQVIVGLGAVGIGFHCTCKRVASVRNPTQLREDPSETIPRGRILPVRCQRLAKGLNRQLEAAQPEQQKPQVELGGYEPGLCLERLPQRFHSLLVPARLREGDGEIVHRQRVVRGDFGSAPIAFDRVAKAAQLVQHDSSLVPHLGGIGELPREQIVEFECGGIVALQ